PTTWVRIDRAESDGALSVNPVAQHLCERRMRVMRFFPKAAFDIDNTLKDWLEKSGSGQGPQVAAFEYRVNQRRRGASLLLGLRNRHFCPKVQTGGRTPNRE